MAIVKMKKLRVMAMASDRDTLLRKLLHLGCVEVSKPEGILSDPEWAALLRPSTSSLADTRAEITNVTGALAALSLYAQTKEGMFAPRYAVTEKEFLSSAAMKKARAITKEINGLLQEFSSLQNDDGRLQAKRAGLLPWRTMDLPLDQEGTVHVQCRFGVCPAAANLAEIRTQLAGSDAAAELIEISSDRQQHYLVLFCIRQDEPAVMELLRPYGFSVTTFPGFSGTPEESILALEKSLQKGRSRQEEIKAKLTGLNSEKQTLQIYLDRLNTEAAQNRDTERLLTDGTVVFFEGWVPASSLQAVSRLFEEKGCAWEATDPTPEEIPDVPVKLKNNKLTNALNLVTEMYSLPAYDGVDPNPLMAPFFILFYGVMMSDMGYGLLMMLISFMIEKKYRPKGTANHLFSLMGYCGISSFIFGVITGGFFGDFIPQIAQIINPNTSLTALPSLFTPLNDTLMILIGAMCLGFVQIITGMVISFVEKIKNGQIMDAIWEEATWWIVFAGAALAILHVTKIVILIGAVMVVVGSGWNAKGFGKITSIFGSVYNHVTGYFGDVLSYSRLMALMLAGSVIAQVFNTLGAIPGNIIVFLIISILGNSLNFALNLLSCYVHDLRLQCLEYFNKFYKDGGKPFQPLAIDTKYVEIQND